MTFDKLRMIRQTLWQAQDEVMVSLSNHDGLQDIKDASFDVPFIAACFAVFR